MTAGKFKGKASFPEQLFSILSKTIVPKAELNYSDGFQLLIAVVLSAQCTDKNVNKVTAQLWEYLHSPEDYIELGQDALENAIRSIGFHKTKAKHIIELCRILLEKHGGNIPDTMEELTELPGVGRKTANVVLNLWFGQPSIAVDTHVFRVARRTGLSAGNTPEAVENDLMKITPRKFLKNAHHFLLLHGRYTCKARKPDCSHCPLNEICPKLLNELQ